MAILAVVTFPAGRVERDLKDAGSAVADDGTDGDNQHIMKLMNDVAGFPLVGSIPQQARQERMSRIFHKRPSL